MNYKNRKPKRHKGHCGLCALQHSNGKRNGRYLTLQEKRHIHKMKEEIKDYYNKE